MTAEETCGKRDREWLEAMLAMIEEVPIYSSLDPHGTTNYGRQVPRAPRLDELDEL